MVELKPRMRVSAETGQKGDAAKSDVGQGRNSLMGGLLRVSIFSQTTTASTALEESFFSLQSASGVSGLSASDIFSNSEVKKDDDALMCTM